MADFGGIMYIPEHSSEHGSQSSRRSVLQHPSDRNRGVVVGAAAFVLSAALGCSDGPSTSELARRQVDSLFAVLQAGGAVPQTLPGPAPSGSGTETGNASVNQGLYNWVLEQQRRTADENDATRRREAAEKQATEKYYDKEYWRDKETEKYWREKQIEDARLAREANDAANAAAGQRQAADMAAIAAAAERRRADAAAAAAAADARRYDR
jgi:hypothetical protein